MASELNIVVLFGGKSGEHDVSRSSAAYIIETLGQCPEYRILPVGITREGSWYAYGGPVSAMREGNWLEEGPVSPATLLPDTGRHFLFTRRQGQTVSHSVDCVFPVLHGRYGEDGTIQGMLEMAGIPFVGCGMTSCALAMDKVFANTIFDYKGIPHTPWQSLDRDSWLKDGSRILPDLVKGFTYPLFVKPARAGSSLGISRVLEQQDLPAAIDRALVHDRKVIIEEAVRGRELEIAALGGYGEPVLSPIGEIIPDRDFYDYDSKYEEHSASQLIIPAELTDGEEAALRKIAVDAWGALECYGLARIDFFLSEDGRILLNEINTMPGFVSISMYPRLFRAAGYGDAQLLRELINLALARGWNGDMR